MTLSRYRIVSGKMTAPVTIAVIADLHNTAYGKKQARLLACVREGAPDAVAIVGDAFHVRNGERHTLEALSALAREFPSYYVIGNHERRSGECASIKSTVRACGVTVLENERKSVVLNGQTVQLVGLDDYGRHSVSLMHAGLIDACAGLQKDRLSILLAHRPERIQAYLPHGFDIVLSGHAHGGQWRFPGARGGLFAPGQGWFPAHAGGAYPFGGQWLIVGRGLSNKPLWLARFGNPPEVVFVTIEPG